MKKNSKIYIADHKGFLGEAVFRTLRAKGYKNILLRARKELDLKNQRQVDSFFKQAKPEYVFMAHQKSGGIAANMKSPADFFYENAVTEMNVIHSSAQSGVKKLLIFGASCIYPKNTSQPIKESSIFSGAVEETSEAYAMAKIAGIEMCKAYETQHGLSFVAVVPATAYGPGAHGDPENSHVLTALIDRFKKSTTQREDVITVWGSGKPLREFIYIEDLANACVFLMESKSASGVINVGSGEEISIKNLALLIKEVMGFKGKITFDKTKPDGAHRKFLDSTKIRRLGWKPHIKLKEGIRKTWRKF